MEKLHKSDKVDEQHYNAFLHELKIFHQNRGSPFHNIPKINGREINLLTFYNAVTDAGGFKILTEHRKWDDIVKFLKFPRGCVNISLSLRKIYIRYLKHYEKIHFMRIQKNENVKAGSQTKKLKICQNVPMVYDIAQHDVTDASRSTFGLNETFVSPNHYVKLCMSLLCGLPNEQELALNICILLSSKENCNFDLSQSPKLVDFLIAQAGVWNSDDDDALKTLYLESWRDVKGRNMAGFWKSVLDVRNDQLAQLLESSLNEDNSDELLLNTRQGIWCPSSEGELVFKVAVIIYNLSFEKKNKSVLAENRTLLRFLLSCIYSSWGTLKQTGYDTLGNIAMELKISAEQDIYSRIILQTVMEGINSSDRFIVIKSMDILSQLCCCIANEDIITSLLNVEVYHQLLQYLTVHDVVLLTHSLDALCALSDLGKYPCDKIASGHHFIATLVSLLTCEANKFEQSAYINMKFVKTTFPVDTNKEITSTSADLLKTTPSAISGSENITSKWLRDNYDENQNCSCSEEEMFSQYILFCKKSGLTQTSLSLFKTSVKGVFPDCRFKISKSKSGVKTNRCFGLKRKPTHSATSKKLNASHSFSSHHTSLVVDNPINNMRDFKAQTGQFFKPMTETPKHTANEESIKMFEEKSKINLNPTVNLNAMPEKILQNIVSGSIFISNTEKLLPCSENKMKNSFTTNVEHVEGSKATKCVDSPISTPFTFSSLKQKLTSKISEDFATSFNNKTDADKSIVSVANDSASVNHPNLCNVIPTATCTPIPLTNGVTFDSIDSLDGTKSQDTSHVQGSKLRTEIKNVILVPQSSEKSLSKSTELSNEITPDKRNSANCTKNNVVSKRLIFSNFSPPSIFLNSVAQSNKELSSPNVLGLQSDSIISKSPLLSSILNKEPVARNNLGIRTANFLSSKDTNLKIIPIVQESTCLKIVPVSPINTTFKIAAHNPENASCLPQNPFIAVLATENSITPKVSDVLPNVPICIEKGNNNLVSAVAYEIISGKSDTVSFQVENPGDSVQKACFVSLQSPQQMINTAPSNSIVSIIQMESQSAATKPVLNNFSEQNSHIVVPCGISPKPKETKQHLVPSVACEMAKYSCNWKDCGLKFSKISSMFLHVSQVHVPASDDDMVCLWDGCGPLKRKRMSLLTHLQDWHCNETSLISQSIKKPQLPLGKKTTVPPLQSVYSPDAAIIAIRRRALQDIDPNQQSAKKRSLNEKEQALEESIHLTCALILRNLVSYSPMARTYIRRYESEIVHLAMSQTESSSILAQCLSYLT